MAKKTAGSRPAKHLHGTPNAIIQSEELSVLAAVDKALASSTNAQVVGANGEIPLRSFFMRYLPHTLRVATGHFITPAGKLSPQLDLMILDSRYPLLSENSDGSVLAMLHSVVGTVECKTRITTSGIKEMWANALTISTLASEVEGYAGDEWGALMINGFAYRSQNRLDTLADRYFTLGTPTHGHVDLYLLRLPPQDHDGPGPQGALLHFEPTFARRNSKKVTGFVPTLMRLYTPLSDLYYTVIQLSYYSLASRGFSLGDIGRHVMDYMSWSSVLSNRAEPGAAPDRGRK